MDKSKLLAKWLQQNSAASKELEKKPKDSPNRLSYGQRRLFFLQQMHSSSPFYNYPELYTLHGNWDIELLRNCIEEVCQKHDIFFHNFILNSDHEPEIILHKERNPVRIEHVDRSEIKNGKSLDEFFIEKGRYVFDLSRDVLFRITIVTISDHDHQILFNLHHIITDKWSMKIFRDELLELYGSHTDINQDTLHQENRYDYLDFSYHQSNISIPEQEIDYWKNKLSNPVEELGLPVDKAPSEITHNGKFNTITLPPKLSRKIKEFAKAHETTLFTFFLAVYNILLHRYSGSDTIQIGTPVSNRDRKEWETVIGFFNETLLLQSQIEGKSSFKEYLKQVKSDVLEAFDHKKVPYETVVSELSTIREVQKNPLFRTMFLFHHKEEEKTPIPNLTMEYETFDIGVAKFDLTIYVEEKKENLDVTFEYSTDLFEGETIDRMQEHFQILLQEVVFNSTKNIKDLNILTGDEVSKFEKWNETGVEVEPIPIDNAFENTVKENLNSIAVTDSDRNLTYKELNERANALANTIEERSLEKKRIGLFFERKAEMIIAMLGTLKSGCSYVPLDPSYPKERIQYIIKDANVDLIVTESTLIADLDIDVETIEIEEIRLAPDQLLKTKTHTIDDEAYVIYTSGSSGKPKGVSISHKNLFFSTIARTIVYENRNPACFLLFSSFSFDSSIAGIYWTLLTGGNLLISQERAEQDIQQVAKLIYQQKVSHTLLLPSLYQVLLQESDPTMLESLEIVIVAGEACTTSTIEQHLNILPDTRLFNEYGPTETTVWCTVHEVSQQDTDDRVPIGRPIPGSKAYILDSNNRRVSIGVTGELFVGGEGVSNGYIGNARKDNERIIDNPFDPGKLYKTGDLASYRKDGTIDFWGRIDDQIKIRGHRVELKEIERALVSLKQIDQATVLFEDKRQQLCAFVIYDLTSEIQAKEVKKRLNEILPKYMVPFSIQSIEDFPRLPNGKIDQKTLMEMTSLADQEGEKWNDEILTSTEKDLIDIWKEILNQKNIGVNDNFFALGGDSISSIRMVSKAKAKGLQLSPTQIFETQTIREISKFLMEKGDQNFLPAITQVAPKTPIQEWFFEFYTAQPNHWHQILEFETQINKTEIEWKILFNSIVERHQVLRSYFKDDTQIFSKKRSASFIDDALYFFKQGDKNHLTEELIQQTNILKKNVFQVLILSESQKTTVRLIAHHLVMDMFSFNQLIHEISGILSNQTIPKKNYQFSQFSNYLKQLNEQGFYDEELSFWESQYSKEAYWDRFYQSNIKEKDLERETIVLSEESTSELTQLSQHSTYKMEEIVLASLLMAIDETLHISEIMVGLEHNGRELPKNISFSDSVGWFTSFYPRKFTIQTGETKASKLIQTLRETPNYGVGFGVLKYLKKEKSLQKFNQFPITYNYIGKLETQTFHLIDTYQYIFEGARNKESKVYSPFDFSAAHVNGKLKISFRYPQKIYSSKNAIELLNNVKQQFVTTIKQLEKNNKVGDDNTDDLSESDLDELSKLFEL